MLQAFLQFGLMPGVVAASCVIAMVSFGIIVRIRAGRLMGQMADQIRRMGERNQQMADRIQSLEKERDNLALWIEDAKQREYIDEKTGIPNEKKMEEDIFLFCREVEVKKIDRFCVTQVDLENFDRINEITSSRKGDIVIRAFAQTVYRSMRRDEFMFRLDSDGKSEAQCDGVFRRQIGGDEFIFLTKGPTNVALGFINRLLKTMPKYSDEISKKLLLPEHIDLSLRAGVVEIGWKEVSEIRTIEAARKYIDMAERRCYKAKNRENNLRVFWPGLVEQGHSSEVSQNAAELTLIHILVQLRRLEEELRMLGPPVGADSRRDELSDQISRLKTDAGYLLEFTYDKFSLNERYQNYIYETKNT